jgi:cephalosporin hydroxylase
VSVVIDDGSHRSEHILATVAHLFPLLPRGSLYAIEDTQTSYWAGYGGSTDPAAPTSVGGGSGRPGWRRRSGRRAGRRS